MFTRRKKNGFFYLGLILISSLLASCAGPTRNALPEKYLSKAQIPGIPNVRAWAYERSDVFQKDLVATMRRRLALRPEILTDKNATVDILALSGGGANGAFGVGLLNGWTTTGKRPNFALVTGISTGALIAPFAYLGSAYDAQIRNIYTSVSTNDIVQQKSIISSLYSILGGSDGLVDPAPLKALIARYMNQDMLNAIAREYARGRRLFIGTTNLDARRLVIWNMGAIAASKHPQALALFQKIILASASIPVAFPPVMIDVEAAGKRYDEMHVDGGVSTEVFFYGAMLNISEALTTLGIKQKPRIRLFIIRNNQLIPPYEEVNRNLLAIADRSLSGLTTMQGIGDLYRIYTVTQYNNIDFNLAYIPQSFHPDSDEPFDPENMKRLYTLGYNLALGGDPWQKYPPGFNIIKGIKSKLDH